MDTPNGSIWLVAASVDGATESIEAMRADAELKLAELRTTTDGQRSIRTDSAGSFVPSGQAMPSEDSRTAVSLAGEDLVQRQSMRMSSIAILVTAAVVGTWTTRWIGQTWSGAQIAMAIVSGVLAAGGAIGLSRSAATPWYLARGVVLSAPPTAPLNKRAKNPLAEIARFVDEAAKRHRVAYAMHVRLVYLNSFVFIALLVWTCALVSMNKVGYAFAFGSGTAGAAALSMRWQPFDRMAKARRLADESALLAAGFHARLQAINEIKSPSTRQRMIWEAVVECTEHGRTLATAVT